MPKTYTPTTKFSLGRLQKICQDLLVNSRKDRTLALEAYEMYKRAVEENPNDAVAKKLMLEALNVAQGAKDATVKAVELVLKIEDSSFRTKKAGISGNTLGVTPSYKDLLEIADKKLNDKKTSNL